MTSWLRPWLILSAGLWTVVAVAEDKPAVKLTTEEQTILELTNKERETAKLPPFKLNAALTEAARVHSVNMAKANKLEHKLDDKDVSHRVNATKYAWMSLGENIAQTTGEEPKVIVQRWMDSKPHRESILRKEFTEIGIGMAKSEKGDIYYTQVFATPKKK